MEKLLSRLRIGEKAGLAFALVGLLFVGVVWYFHQTLQSVLGDYQQLQTVFERRKSLSLEIEIEMAAVREAEKDFLGEHQERYADEVAKGLQILREKVSELAAIDEQSRQTAEELLRQLTTYEETFHAAAEAWRRMGLDENSGLQGSFREKIHRLQDLSVNYNVDRLYTLLLQIRRSEKDLALRRDPAYRERVRKLVVEFRQLIENSGLKDAVKKTLLTELATYATSFEPYAETVLRGENTAGGKGPFRDAAHRIEAILEAYHIPDLESSVLKLRRREKDFLLRGGEAYPPMVVDIASSIRARIKESAIAEADKVQLLGLLNDYQESFLALAAQRATMEGLSRKMDAAADRVAPLIKQNVEQANQLMATRIGEINESSQASERLGLLVMAGAIVLAVFFALIITKRIVRTVRQTAGLLDDLAYGRPTERVPVVSGGRDEINSMNESLNALLDHRANFLAWWKTSMDELNALRDLNSEGGEKARDEATRDLRAAAVARLQHLNGMHAQLLQHVEHVLDVSRHLTAGGGVRSDDAISLEHAARSIAAIVAVLQSEDVPASRSAITADAAEQEAGVRL